MAKNMDILLKTDDPNINTTPNNSDILFYSKRKIKSICKALCINAIDYRPEKTIASIKDYIESKDNKERILYSEISSFIFGLNENQRGTFASNIEKLLLYSLNEKNNVDEDCNKIVIKIYDHFHLALHQVENVKSILSSGVEDAKDSIKKDVKGIEKEYITILGIFASVVLTFVGGVTFSSSVLQNIDSISIYRLLIVIDLLAVILSNVIYILVKFICQINDKEIKIFKVTLLNVVYGCIAFIVIVAWIIDAHSLSEFVRQFFPWIC